MIPFDDNARAAMRTVLAKCKPDRDLIVVLTQFNVGNQFAPSHPNWGKPNPIDINGLIEMAFAEGIRFANAK